MFDCAGEFDFLLVILSINLWLLQKDNREAQESQQIRIYGKVAFHHKILPQSQFSPRTVTVTGNPAYAIGKRVALVESWPRRHFQSFLVIVEAKVQFGVHQALPELLAYLSCLRQARLQQNRSDASVYGISSDGYIHLRDNHT